MHLLGDSAQNRKLHSLAVLFSSETPETPVLRAERLDAALRRRAPTPYVCHWRNALYARRSCTPGLASQGAPRSQLRHGRTVQTDQHAASRFSTNKPETAA